MAGENAVDIASFRRNSHDEVLDNLTKGIAGVLQDAFADSPCRDFFLWCSSPQSPAQPEWLRLSGSGATHAMTEKVLLYSMEDAHAEHLLGQSSALNTYLAFDAVANDLGIGLGMDPRLDGPHERLRRKLATDVNHAAIRALSRPRPAAPMLLADSRASARRIDFLIQTPSGAAYSQLVKAFNAQCGRNVRADVRAALWPLLVGNIIAARGVLRAIRGLRYAEPVRRYLLGRYTGVNRMIGTGLRGGIGQRLESSADAILASTTLGYYIAFLLDTPEYRDVPMEEIDLLLFRALSACNRLVCLLSDIGPELLKNQSGREDLANRITDATAATDSRFDEVLARVCADDPMTTRLEKDLTRRQTNLALDSLHALPVAKAAPAFVKRLNYFAHAYGTAERSLIDACQGLRHLTGRSEISKLVLNFFSFHDSDYANSYNLVAGGYSGVSLRMVPPA
ncbi:hypothetical protein MULP_02290 [Mycobacterium liflandii 128FXT]|uniref:Uncharacterized protein n=2 Tax=Mycobacterium TaxID=1763 RepID=L7V9R2_MYCL1|nr:hypothetical protein MULP_02290 [Mycobacterium liflandii 128FXT]